MRNLAAMEARIRILEKKIDEIYPAVVAEKRIDGVDEDALLDRLCQQAVNGNRVPLDEYCRRKFSKQAGNGPGRGREAEGETA